MISKFKLHQMAKRGIDVLNIVRVGDEAGTVVAGSLVGVDNLGTAMFRVQVMLRP